MGKAIFGLRPVTIITWATTSQLLTMTECSSVKVKIVKSLRVTPHPAKKKYKVDIINNDMHGHFKSKFK